MGLVNFLSPDLLNAVDHVQGVIDPQPDEDGKGGDDHRRQRDVHDDGGTEGDGQSHHDRCAGDDDHLG